MSPHPLSKRPTHQDKEDKPRTSSASSVSDDSPPEVENGGTTKQERDSDGEVAVVDSLSGDEQQDSGTKAANGNNKRKRGRKGLDKKYLCPQDGCGKSYSRAEHLYRHQLNHTPKQIYRCDYPDCPRFFVRQDLCARHRERHTTRGSHLQRKDNYLVNADQSHTATHGMPSHSNSDLAISTGSYNPPSYELQAATLQSPLSDSKAGNNGRAGDPGHGDTFRSPQSYTTQPATAFSSLSGIHRSNSDSQYFGEAGLSPQESPAALRNSAVSNNYNSNRHSSFGSLNAVRFQKGSGTNSRSGLQTSEQSENSSQYRVAPSAQATSRQGSGYDSFIPQQNFPPLTNLPPPVYPTIAQNGPFQPQFYSSSEIIGSQGISTDEMTGILTSDSPMTDGSLPMFEESYNRSPIVMADNFTAWLFNNGTSNRGDNAILGSSLRMPLNGAMPMLPQQHSMAVTSILDAGATTAILSESKRQELLALIEKRFNETSHSPFAKQKESLLSGDRDMESHVFSLRSLQTYIGSYWYHFHDQLPILHQPTFFADKTQNLLLIAILAIGAANLDKMHGETYNNAAADLASFLAWHLRGELFMHQDFRPPAKLWILQALLLLECYEKLYSSRVLHERSQIHHATTISLLRRGSSLLGRSAMDSPPNQEEEKTSIVDSPDPWWNHWITNEATKRVAFAAFIIDSVHATMFSHTAVMVAHEMRLPLPCDESLWTATSGMEVARIENQLQNDGIKPISFLDGLKSTLNGRPVRSNTFGRTALMSGLLNVSFHLGQRDMQVRSLGVIGGKDVWRGTLTKAFDIWERDWDTNSDSSHLKSYRVHVKEDENMFESRVVLHHLAHMGMHVDIVQCQIFAKAKRLLGRRITPSDYNSTVRRMREVWAPKASARDAVFYSLKFLGQVIPDMQEYSPRDDYLVNRPWVVYFAALVVWSYGYALDGALSTVPPLLTDEDQRRDMHSFMQRVGGVEKPDDLSALKNRNSCAGLLMFLARQFQKCRWELMHEATILLDNCVEMLRHSS